MGTSELSDPNGLSSSLMKSLGWEERTHYVGFYSCLLSSSFWKAFSWIEIPASLTNS